MISVEEAIRRICGSATPLDTETVPLGSAHHRVLARDVIARRDQPPAPISAMDGYAVRLADAQHADARLHVVGTAPAGHPFLGKLGAGQAVRIFTGGVVPDGADAIAIQENVQADGDHITLSAPATAKHIRAAGLDFRQNEVLVAAGRKLSARDLALIAAGDIPIVDVQRKPIIAFASTGDELAPPGSQRRVGAIVASSGYGLAALIETTGGIALDLGIIPDTVDALQRIPDASASADVIVTMGGASVGDHDLVQRALIPKGFALDFWKIAMRPGKPLIFGRLIGKPFLGLPGNPVSGYVCALLFLKPLIAALLGTTSNQPLEAARLSGSLRENDSRQEYLRARLTHRDSELWCEAFPLQDSSMQRALARADALIVRAPHAVAAVEGDIVDIIRLSEQF